MLKLTWIEFFIRVLPEAFIIIWGIHVSSRQSLKIQKYIFSSIVVAILVFFVRWLPIWFGVHMIINIILTIKIMFIIRIPLKKALCSTLLLYFLLSVSEFLNMKILNLLNINISYGFLNPLTKWVFGIPSLLFIVIFILIIDYLLKIRERVKITDYYN